MPSYALPGSIQVSKARLARGTSGVRQLVVHNQLHRCRCPKSTSMLFAAIEGALERPWQELSDGVMNCMLGYVCTKMCTCEARCLSTHMFSVTGQAIRVGTCQKQYQWKALVPRIPKMPSYALPGSIQVSKARLARGTTGVRQLVVHNKLHRCRCPRSTSMLFGAMNGALERSWQELSNGVVNCMLGHVCTEMCTCLSTHMLSQNTICVYRKPTAMSPTLSRVDCMVFQCDARRKTERTKYGLK
jgi:hypothetical protein